jgi:hypothetical protein
MNFSRCPWTILTLAFLGPAVAQQQPVYLQSEQLKESSGLVVSPSNSDLVWSHNDSGYPPLLYAFDRENGRLSAIVELRGAPSVDWEALAAFSAGGKQYLAVGDIGDNRRRRSSISIHVAEEPKLQKLPKETPDRPLPGSSTANFSLLNYLTLRVTFPTGPADSEAMVFDPEHSRFLLLTKELLRCRVFSVPFDLSRLTSIGLPQLQEPIDVEAELLQTLRIPVATGADLSPDGQTLAVCTYGPAYLLQREGLLWQQQTMQRVRLPKRRQGEAIAFLDRDHLLVTSEFAPTPLWTVPIPAAPPPSE